MISDWDIIRHLLRREFHIGRNASVLQSVAFFLLACLLFAFHLGSTQDFAPVIIWVLFMLAFMFGNTNMFVHDHQSDILAQLWLGNVPLFYIVLTRIFATWVVRVGSLILALPIAGIWLQMPTQQFVASMACLAIAGLGGSASVVAMNTLIARKGASAVFVMLLVFPLLIPLMIFGISASMGTDIIIGQAFYLLVAISLGSTLICVPAAIVALRSNL
ncbi:MAG: heme exporter protein CcmB [Pseudomonadota bacterium]